MVVLKSNYRNLIFHSIGNLVNSRKKAYVCGERLVEARSPVIKYWFTSCARKVDGKEWKCGCVTTVFQVVIRNSVNLLEHSKVQEIGLGQEHCAALPDDSTVFEK